MVRIWRAFALQPHRTETFKLSRDPLFVDKVRDIVGLYMSPPDRALVLCVDEKPPIQALERTAPVLPMRPGQVERRTHDYVRHGTTDLFAALDVKTGKVIGACQRRHRAPEFRAFLDLIDRERAARPGRAPRARQRLHPQDAADPRWLAKRPRYHLHFTPTSASWLNLVEGWFALLTAPPAPARRLPQHPRPRAGDPRLHRRHQPGPEALRLDQVRRRHPRQRPALLPKNF